MKWSKIKGGNLPNMENSDVKFMTFDKIEWTDETIEEFWRYWSERPDTYFAEALGDTIVQFTLQQKIKIGTALDFGAGSGGLLAALSRRGFRSFGLDFGDTAKVKLRTRFEDDTNVERIFGLKNAAQFKEFFDSVFLIETIEHLPDRHLTSSISQIFSMLKPNGWLIVSTPNDEDLEKSEVYCPVSKLAFHPMQHLRSWNKATLYQFLIDAAFVPVNCFEIDLQALS